MIPTVEPTNKFILEVVKALLIEEVPHKAILSAIDRLEQMIETQEKHRQELDRIINPLVFNANISTKSDE